MKVLSVNAGSSSLKFTAYTMPEEEVLISGVFERIGIDNSFYTIKINGEKIKKSKALKNHDEAVQVLIDELFENKVIESLDEIKAVGHRVVHGGEKYSDSVVITDEVIEDIKELTKFATLHHPGNLAGINAMMSAIDVQNVAVFDTAFHQTMPAKNFIYPVPYEWYQKYGVRKYGFHGTSHKYITEVMKEKLGKEDINIISCHIGSGSSIAVIKDGKCVDTTMGLTPLDGLMMGTRCGSIDPSIIEYICKESGMSIAEVNNELNKKSGCLGISGVSDNRDMEEKMVAGDELATLGFTMFTDRIAKYVVDYFIELNGKVDAIVFTAGIGENGIVVRKMVMDRLNPIGIYTDEERNSSIAGFKAVNEGIISTDDSKIPVMVMPTDEEIMIVRDTYKFVA